MWAPPESDGYDDIRQGDVLRGLILPNLKTPIRYLNSGEVSNGDIAAFSTPQKARDYLVVSQCCDLENGSNVAVAPVKSTRPLPANQRAALYAESPNEETGYSYSQFGLSPLEGLIEPRVDNQAMYAALDEIQTYLDASEHFGSCVIARMTPAGRRLLRMKLSLFFGRAEADDAAQLRSMGISEGF